MRKIAQISDLHFGRHDPAAADALLDAIARKRPDLVVVSGDLTQRARTVEFEAARRFIERIAPPKLVIPGNHDIPLFNLLGRFLAPNRKFDRHAAPLGVPDSFFQDSEIAVLGLNTARRLTGKNGRVSLEQMDQLRRLLGGVPEGVFKVLVTHHPLGTPAGILPVEVAGRAVRTLDACAKAGVHLLLSGHYHAAISGHGDLTEVANGNSVLIVHAGTAISDRTRGSEGNTFNLIGVETGRVTVTVLRWEKSKGFEDDAVLSYGLEGGRWHPLSDPEFK